MKLLQPGAPSLIAGSNQVQNSANTALADCACGKGITPDSLRCLYSGDEVVLIQVWNQVGISLDKLDVSKG